MLSIKKLEFCRDYIFNPFSKASKKSPLSRSLGIQFSLLLALVWFVGSSLTILGLSQYLNLQAEQAVKERAEILLATTQAARNYTRDYIQPLLKGQSTHSQDFIQESIPNFAARTTFSNFQQQDAQFQDFVYKEATPNPTNPLDRADNFEAQLFTELQQQSNPQASDPLSGYRVMAGEKQFYLARPLVMKDVSCLECHGSPRDAPPYLLEMYGDQNGFEWQLNDVVAAQMVYVPANTIFERGRQNLFTVTKMLLSIFGALFVVINLLLWKTVIQPLKVLTNIANYISSCSVNTPQNINRQDFPLESLTLRRDEPGQLARAFQYMVYVLGQREQDLQQAVQERTQSLELEMRDRQTAQEAVQTYSHAINHDLRNLAMGISSLIQGIFFKRSHSGTKGSLQGTRETLVKGGAKTVEIDSTALTMIKHSCERQLKLMNTLMEVQSSDNWQVSLQLEVVDLPQLTQEIEMMYRSKCALNQSTLTTQGQIDFPFVNADISQIKRVFENLIDNALKYNPDGVAITLGVRIWERDRSMICCTVSDDGIGISAEQVEAIFNLYTRGQPQNQTPGYGLGLYICKQIVEAHGGQIGVDIAQPSGTQFWFTIPVIS